MPGGASLWALSSSCLGCDSGDQAVLTPYMDAHSLPCSGVDIIQQTVHCRNWSSLSVCTPTSYARLPWMPFLPHSGSNTIWIIFSHSCLSQLTSALTPCAGLPLLWTPSSLCSISDTLSQATLLYPSSCNTQC